MTEMPKSPPLRLASSEYGQRLLSPKNAQSTGYTFSKAATLAAFNDLKCNHLETMMCAEVLQIRECDKQITEIDLQLTALHQLRSDKIQ